MSFYDAQPWAAAQGRQPTWDQQKPASRSEDTSSVPAESPAAFLTQIEEVERAIDNLTKSGKIFPGGPGPHMGPARRDSFPVHGRGYTEIESRSGGPSRHQSVSEYDGGRPNSSVGLQGYYASQRFQQRQQPDQDQMLQAKRRMAAQRERELRNYHQEQQYNRNSASVKSERSLSPNAVNDDDRRDLISRQHRALYGQESALYPGDGAAPRPSQDARASIGRGPSPLAFDPFGMQKTQSGADSAVQMPIRDQVGSISDRRPSISPPSASRSNFGVGDNNSSSAANSAASPITSPSIGSGNMPSIATQGGMAPIGSRPTQSTVATSKRSVTPNERSASAASNPNAADKTPALGGWGSSSGVWGASKNAMGVQASVWG